MEYSVTLSDDQQYIICTVTGDFTAEEANSFTTDNEALARESGCKKVLVDVRNAANVSSTLENYEFAYHDKERSGVHRNLRVAVLASPSDHSHDFVQTVVSNAGYCFRVFREESEALTWLGVH